MVKTKLHNYTILHILSDYINCSETVINSDIDFDLLTQLAKSQEVEGIVYYQLSKSPTVDLAKLAPLQQKYAFSLYVYKNRMAKLGKIETALTEAKIPLFIFKGSEIASLYPIPAFRTIGDSDVLVHPEDREKTHAVFENLGLVRTESGPNEWMYDCKGMEFELHCRLMNEGEVGNYDSHKVFMYRHWDYAVAEPGTYHYHLDMSYHFVFLILHLRKHLVDRIFQRKLCILFLFQFHLRRCGGLRGRHDPGADVNYLTSPEVGVTMEQIESIRSIFLEQ